MTVEALVTSSTDGLQGLVDAALWACQVAVAMAAGVAARTGIDRDDLRRALRTLRIGLRVYR